MNPIINLNEIREFITHGSGKYQSSHAKVSEKIGAKKLGYHLVRLEPGKSMCPFHNHHVNEELFLILEGNGCIRFGGEEKPIKTMDIIACPPGDRSLAHQIINTGDTTLLYLALSTNEDHEICEYPDSNKVMAFKMHDDGEAFKKIFRIHEAVDYFDGEDI